jgi:uncharacterized membrane protein
VIMGGFAAVGLLTSAYLTFISLIPPTSCPLGEFGIFSCDKVIWSKYSHFYGVSVAALGLGWFIIASSLLLIAWRNERYIRAVFAWSLLGAAGVVAFVYTEVFLLGSICQLCTLAHLSGLGILAISIMCLRAQ